MGREASITTEQVHAAADVIRAEGGKPTLRAIRERLGGVGSMGTIQTMLQSWKASQERQVAADLVLPPALQRVVLDFMRAEIDQARKPLVDELAELQQASADLAQENERQGNTIDDLEKGIEELQAQKGAAEGRAGQLESDLVAAKVEAAEKQVQAEAARTELAKALLRLEGLPRLEADLVAVRAEMTQERAARVAAEQSAAVTAARLEASERRATEAEVRELANRERAEVLARELAASNQSVQAGQARLEAAARELESARALTKEARDLAKASGEVAAELRGRLAVVGEAKAG